MAPRDEAAALENAAVGLSSCSSAEKPKDAKGAIDGIAQSIERLVRSVGGEVPNAHVTVPSGRLESLEAIVSQLRKDVEGASAGIHEVQARMAAWSQTSADPALATQVDALDPSQVSSRIENPALEERLDALDARLSQLHLKVDEPNADLIKLSNDLAKLSSDVDWRLEAFRHRISSLGGSDSSATAGLLNRMDQLEALVKTKLTPTAESDGSDLRLLNRIDDAEPLVEANQKLSAGSDTPCAGLPDRINQLESPANATQRLTAESVITGSRPMDSLTEDLQKAIVRLSSDIETLKMSVSSTSILPDRVNKLEVMVTDMHEGNQAFAAQSATSSSLDRDPPLSYSGGGPDPMLVQLVHNLDVQLKANFCELSREMDAMRKLSQELAQPDPAITARLTVLEQSVKQDFAVLALDQQAMKNNPDLLERVSKLEGSTTALQSKFNQDLTAQVSAVLGSQPALLSRVENLEASCKMISQDDNAPSSASVQAQTTLSSRMDALEESLKRISEDLSAQVSTSSGPSTALISSVEQLEQSLQVVLQNFSAQLSASQEVQTGLTRRVDEMEESIRTMPKEEETDLSRVRETLDNLWNMTVRTSTPVGLESSRQLRQTQNCSDVQVDQANVALESEPQSTNAKSTEAPAQRQPNPAAGVGDLGDLDKEEADAALPPCVESDDALKALHSRLSAVEQDFKQLLAALENRLVSAIQDSKKNSDDVAFKSSIASADEDSQSCLEPDVQDNTESFIPSVVEDTGLNENSSDKISNSNTNAAYLKQQEDSQAECEDQVSPEAPINESSRPKEMEQKGPATKAEDASIQKRLVDLEQKIQTQEALLQHLTAPGSEQPNETQSVEPGFQTAMQKEQAQLKKQRLADLEHFKVVASLKEQQNAQGVIQECLTNLESRVHSSTVEPGTVQILLQRIGDLEEKLQSFLDAQIGNEVKSPTQGQSLLERVAELERISNRKSDDNPMLQEFCRSWKDDFELLRNELSTSVTALEDRWYLRTEELTTSIHKHIHDSIEGVEVVILKDLGAAEEKWHQATEELVEKKLCQSLTGDIPVVSKSELAAVEKKFHQLIREIADGVRGATGSGNHSQQHEVLVQQYADLQRKVTQVREACGLDAPVRRPLGEAPASKRPVGGSVGVLRVEPRSSSVADKSSAGSGMSLRVGPAEF